MNAAEFYENTHGNAQFLSKDAIIHMMALFAEARHQEYLKAEKDFHSEKWAMQRKDARKRGERSP